MKSPQYKTRRRNRRWLQRWDRKEMEIFQIHRASDFKDTLAAAHYLHHTSFRRIRDRVLKELSK